MSAEGGSQVQAQDHGTKAARGDSPREEREREREQDRSGAQSRNGRHSRSSNATDSSRDSRNPAGAEFSFVAPANYLKPLGRPQGVGARAGAPGLGDADAGYEESERRLSSVDRDQVRGLVSCSWLWCA